MTPESHENDTQLLEPHKNENNPLQTNKQTKWCPELGDGIHTICREKGGVVCGRLSVWDSMVELSVWGSCEGL